MSIRWGEITKKGCKGDQRTYSAICWDAGSNAEQACKALPANKSEKTPPSAVSGPPDRVVYSFPYLWGEWDRNDVDCGYVEPSARPEPPSVPSDARNLIRWGEITPKGCVGSNREYSARCWDAGTTGGRIANTGSWENNCAALDARWSEQSPPAGVTGKPDKITRSGLAVFGVWNVPDTECGADPTAGVPPGTEPQAERKTCFTQTSGEYGPYRAGISEPLRVNVPFTLQAVNWIAPDASKYTFLRSEGGALRTDDNVQTSATTLPAVFQFMFRKVGQCGSGNREQIHYGDRLQLYSVASKQYARCAAGTCSLVASPNDCLADKWETFTVSSQQGKTGPVCFGDLVRISQTVGDRPDITPAGGGAVWATAQGSNQNAVLAIMPPNGSLYADPTQETAAKSEEHCAELCKRDPSNPQCTLGACSSVGNFFSQDLLKYVAIGAGVLLAIFVIGLIIRSLLRGSATRGGAGATPMYNVYAPAPAQAPSFAYPPQSSYGPPQQYPGFAQQQPI